MKISLRNLATAPNAEILFDYTIDLSEEEVNFEHPFKKPVIARGRVKDNAGVVTLDADIDAVIFTQCARCLKELCVPKHLEISFILAKTLEDEDRDDIIVVSSDDLELDEILVSELILNTEMVFLCSENCKGLCPHCGKDLNAGPCECANDEIDPRLDLQGKVFGR